jgi:PA domain
VRGNVVYVGRGCPADSITASNPDDPYLANPAGQIALIDRGSCPVSLKIDRAARAGATGTLIDLVAPGDAVTFSYGGGSVFVPSLVITQATGNAIKTALGSAPLNVSINPDRRIPAPFSKLCGPG